jgi:dinuclear metal center YbgI/SA1388 family protein
MAELESILCFLDDLMRPWEFTDYAEALNGLQVAGPSEVVRVGAAVDASLITLREARERRVGLLLVHHGLFWGGLAPLTGPRFLKIEALVRGNMALYSMHLPLDAHEELGNCVLLARALGLEPVERFGEFRGARIGWWAEAGIGRLELAGRMREELGGEVRVIPGGPDRVGRVGILTGAGSGSLAEAAALGLDALVTGEAPHHVYHEAMEAGINLFLGGHYATEVFGVRALAQQVAQSFDLEWEFLHQPTGM